MSVRPAEAEFEAAVEDYHAALRQFVTGDTSAIERSFSEGDASLCNPFVPFAVGRNEAVRTMRAAASNFRNGEYESERKATYVTDQMACIVELERANGVLAGEQGSIALRVTTVFRPEAGGWKVVHRHADPTTTEQPVESVVQR